MEKKDKRRFLRAFGRQVRKLRVAAHLKRIDALEVGIDPNNLGRIERGKRASLVVFIPRLAKFLKVHQTRLLDFPFDYNADPIVPKKQRAGKKK